MKKILILCLFPIYVFAGGVDVGNGTAIIVDFYSLSFDTEEQLIDHLKKTVKNIKSYKYPELKNNLLDAECEGVDVNIIEPRKEYEVVDNEIVHHVKYRGIIKIEVYNCNKPELLNLEYKP